MTVCELASLKMSSHGLIARVVMEEKGVSYERIEIAPDALGGAAYRADHHPFGKVPSLRHGDVHLYETAAIVRYVDEAFDGPELQPSTAALRAEMQKWISVASHYVYPSMIGGIVLPRIMAQSGGPVADESAVAKATEDARHQLDVVEARLSNAEYLAGEVSLADFFLASVVQYLPLTDEGKALMNGHPATQDWVGRITGRPSYAAAAWE
ncbi:MAG: glutathione S-transferase family protein [Pseudomonadota bacterium]